MTATTDDYSFAEIEELKNLLILHFMDSGKWDWSWALHQFAINRSELNGRKNRHLGFGRSVAVGGPAGCGEWNRE
jgi:hypothetical protein